MQIAADHPGTEHAFAAQRKLAYVYIALDQPVEAQAAFAKMFTDFAGHERLPHAIHEIAENCNKLSKADEVGELCRNTLDSGLFAESAVWLQMGIAVSNAYCGNDAAADAAIEQLIRDFSADSRAAEGVGQTAWAYRKLQRHDRARVLYQYVVDNWPDNERAIFSQRGIVLTSIALDDQQKADSATEKLLTNFSQDKRLPKAIFDIVGAYRGKGNHEKSRALAQYIVDNYPASGETIWAQQRVIFACIALEDDPNTEAGIDALFARFSSHKDIASAVYGTARKLNNKNNVKAEELYQYIVDNHPDHKYVPFAHANIGNLKLRAGDDAGANAVYEKVHEDFVEHPLFAKTLALIADGYWDRACLGGCKGPNGGRDIYYRKAIAYADTIIRNFPEIPHTTAEAHHLAGCCYERMYEYTEAIAYYQSLVDNWPDYTYAWDAQFRIGHHYQRLRRIGAVDESEAHTQTKAAYERVVSDYPNCRAANAARNWLRNHVE